MSTLRQLLKNRYKIDLSDKEYANLQFIMSIHNFTPVNCRFDAYNDISTLINNIHLLKKFDINRSKTDIIDEEVIYSLYPLPYGESTEINISIPKVENKKMERAIDKQFEPDFKHNITIVRTRMIKSELASPMKIEEEFVFMLYSEDLNIRAGIIFESMPDTEKAGETDDR